MMRVLGLAVLTGAFCSVGCKAEKKQTDDSSEERSSKKAKKTKLRDSTKEGFGGILGEDGFNVFAELDDPEGAGDGVLSFSGEEHSPNEPAKFSAGWVGRESAIVLRKAVDKEYSSKTVQAQGHKCLVFDDNRMVRRLMINYDDVSFEYAFNAAGQIILWFSASREEGLHRRLAFFHGGRDLKLYQTWEDRGPRRTETAPQGIREDIFAAANRCLDAFGASNPRAGSNGAQPVAPVPVPPPPPSPAVPVERQAATMPMEGIGYNIVAKHSGLCLEVARGARDQGTEIVQAACDGSAQQRFKLWIQDKGVMIAADHTGMCFDVEGSNKENQAALKQWPCGAAANQTFSLQSMGGADFRLAARHSGRCIDIAEGKKEAAAKAIQFDCHESDNQRFQFVTAR
jgi:hypothetical protein